MNDKSSQLPPLKYIFLAGFVFAVTNVFFSQLFNHWGEFKLWLLKLFA